jgi:hypothetical protein
VAEVVVAAVAVAVAVVAAASAEAASAVSKSHTFYIFHKQVQKEWQQSFLPLFLFYLIKCFNFANGMTKQTINGQKCA